MSPRRNHTAARVAGVTVVGLFVDQPAAERGIQALKAAGFSEQEIGVAVRDKQQQQEITEGTGTQAAEGAAKGAVGGGVLGGVVGLLAGVGALVIPGIGPIIAGGALASTLTGAGIGAAAGGLIGALVGMGVPEENAKHFERGFQQGGVLVTVEAGADVERAQQVLVLSGADLGADLGPAAPSLREAGIDSQGDARVTERGATVSESWRGNERRYNDDASYTGPERRLATL